MKASLSREVARGRGSLKRINELWGFAAERDGRSFILTPSVACGETEDAWRKNQFLQKKKKALASLQSKALFMDGRFCQEDNRETRQNNRRT